MVVVLYDPPQFARFYTGFAAKYPRQYAEDSDTFRYLHHTENKRRDIHEIKLVRPPISGKGYCVDCVRKFDYEDIGLYHQGHLIDIRDLQFNQTEIHE